MTSFPNNLLRDRVFWLAMAAGPVFWLAYAYFVELAVSRTWSAQVGWLFLQTALVYPVLEELVFRGWIQGRLLVPRLPAHPWRGITWANILASVLFSLVHLVNHPPIWAIAVFFPSLVFGFFYDRYQRVTPSIILHVFYNTGFFLLFVTTSD